MNGEVKEPMCDDVEEPMYSDDSTDDEEAEVLVVLSDFEIILSQYQEYPQSSGAPGLELYEYPVITPLSYRHKNTPGLVIMELIPFMPDEPSFYAYTSDDTLRRNPKIQTELARMYKVKYYEPVH